MNFEIQVFLQRIAIPAVASLVGGWILLSTEECTENYEDEPLQGIFLKTLLGTVLCGTGLLASDLLQRGLLLKPEDWLSWKASYQWQWMAILIPSSFVVLGLLRSSLPVPKSIANIAWPMLAILTTCTVVVSLMEPDVLKEEKWKEELKSLLWRIAVGTAAILLNIATLDNLARSGAARWTPLVLVGQLGCVAAIILQSYASLGEWTLACIGSTVGLSIGSLIKGSQPPTFASWQLSSIVFPLTIASGVSLLLSPYFQSQPLSLWLQGSVLVLPTAVWLVDIIFTRFANPWVRALCAAGICSVLLAAILLITKPFQSEW
ncbi:MAG: hypothetical protein ACK56W_15975 [Pirellula sp.]|jgi:hypothetical protein|nr:hypothetical protein [Pirellula sp.]